MSRSSSWKIRADIYFPLLPLKKLAAWQRPFSRIFKKLGPTWRAAPIRRIIQVSCLAIYLALFFWVGWPYPALESGGDITAREYVPFEFFLWIDPLVGLSTAVAARTWNVALLGMGGILLVCLFFPRGFCGYICPLGTTIDFFDWLVGKRITRFRLQRGGWWVHLKYYILLGVMAAAALGFLISGFVAAIPVLTRGLLLSAGQAQAGWMRNWSQAQPWTAAIYFSLGLFLVVFLLGLMSPRFWCKYVCPSGALFSLFNFFRVGERKVEDTCINCNKCVEICPFDAIKEDFTTRTNDCTFCQSCGGACPTQSIVFVPRWAVGPLKKENDPEVTARPISRRSLVFSALGGAAAAIAGPAVDKARGASAPLRPPGSVPEQQFLDLCIRCGECFKVCPGPVLHEAGLKHGLEGLWTPIAVPTHAGCHQDCNYCTQVCPTGAILPLTIEEKRTFKMGLAIINEKTCLPHAGEEDCQLCYDECEAANYHAIEMRPITLPLPEGELPEGMSLSEWEEMATISAPFILEDACVGCGLCENRCHVALHKQRGVLDASAIVVVPPK